MNCFYCGKKQRGANQMFYKLDQDGHIICQSCMSAGYWKDALEIIEHNKQIDKECSGCIYEDVDGSTSAISNCVCCSRNVEYAKNDYYKKKIKT